MKTPTNGTAPRRRPSVALIAQALNEAVQDAVDVHKQAGLPLAVWQDGKVALVPADKIKSRRNGPKSGRRKTRY
jgi:hypothetical protein